MNPASKATTVLRSLTDGPATATELANALDMSRSFVAPTLTAMHRNGYVKRSIFHRRGHGPSPFIYQLTEIGERQLSKPPTDRRTPEKAE